LNAKPPPSPFTPPRPNIMPIIHKSMESIVLSEMFPFERLELALGTIPSGDRDCTSRIEKTAHRSPLYEFSEPQRGCAEGKRSVRLLRNREYLSPPCGLRNESALTYKRFAGPELTPTVSCSPRVSYSRMLNSPVDTRAAGRCNSHPGRTVSGPRTRWPPSAVGVRSRSKDITRHGLHS
jgi:hypothetical protein